MRQVWKAHRQKTVRPLHQGIARHVGLRQHVGQLIARQQPDPGAILGCSQAREILRIDSKSKIGRIWADMEKFEPATETGPSPPCNVSR